MSNVPQVTAAEYGRCYARSIPTDYWDDGGTTEVFWVRAEGDEKVATFPWYASQIHLMCPVSRNGEMGIVMVRQGRWPRGREATEEALQFAFYFNDELLASYSTLDVAGAPGNVEASVSHHEVIARIDGFDWVSKTFRAETIYGRTLVFEVLTGKLMSE